MATFSIILRDCPEPARLAVGQLLGRAFSLKDATCASIAESVPIVLLQGLSHEEAAVLTVILSGFQRLGAVLEYVTDLHEDIPKIDWPRRPQVFKRDLTDLVLDFAVPITLADGRRPLVDLLVECHPDGKGSRSFSGSRSGTTPPKEFRGIQLPEITPFGGVTALPPRATPVPPPAALQTAATPSANDAVSRLNELFPEEESSGFVPNNQDISSILNKLLPDDDAPSGSRRTGVPTPVNGNSQQGFALFLAKIADEGRRQKAVPLIAELAGIPAEEADALSKKVIIPVLKGATQEAAETAKQRFAKIGILARVKGPE